MCDKDLPAPFDPIVHLSLLSKLRRDPTLMDCLTAQVQDCEILNPEDDKPKCSLEVGGFNHQ